MTRVMRPLLILVSLLQLFFAVAFYVQWPFAVNLWPFEGTTPLTFIFMASIFAAAGTPALWAVLSGNLGALAGVGLDYLTIFIPLAVYAFLLGLRGDDPGLLVYVAFFSGALFGLILFLWSVRIPLDRSRPTPALVRAAFAFFIVALLITGGRLVFQVPNIIPWTITPQLSVIIGCIFLGAAMYFAYGLLRPAWSNAAGQLIGFLVYDIVLIVPFLNHLSTVAPEHRLGLFIYIAVVVFSALIAIYYLFLNPRTRLRRTPPATAQPKPQPS